MSAHHHYIFHVDLYHDHHNGAFHHFFNRPCHYDDELDINDLNYDDPADLIDIFDHDDHNIAWGPDDHGVDVSADGDGNRPTSGGGVAPV